MSTSSDAEFPAVSWTWHDGRGGLLRTRIFPDGRVVQERQATSDDVTTPQKLGEIPASEAAALLTQCSEVLAGAPPTPQALPQASPQAAPNGETYELMVAQSQGQAASRQVARTALDSDAALQGVRQAILAARNRVYRRWNIWRSAGARWYFLTTVVTLALALNMALDMKHDAALQARSHHTTGTVVERGGEAHKNESLRVKLDGEDAAPTVKIFKYLSHPNWEAAKPGSKVDVLYNAQSKQAWLATDLLRWQSDKKTIWLIPGFLLLAALVGLAWLRRYEIGVHSDGQEYLILQDRVAADDKTAAISRSAVLFWKMFV